jgi:hypothetical protein
MTLHCSNCGEEQDSIDPEDTASDCCLCDLVPITSLPALMLEMRREILELEMRVL